MSGRSVARLIFACILSSCYYSPPPVVVITPASAPEGPGAKQPSPPPEIDGPYTTKRGNCMQVTQNQNNYCFWSWSNPSCPVPLNDCRNITNKCNTPATSNPPPC